MLARSCLERRSRGFWLRARILFQRFIDRSGLFGERNGKDA